MRAWNNAFIVLRATKLVYNYKLRNNNMIVVGYLVSLDDGEKKKPGCDASS